MSYKHMACIHGGTLVPWVAAGTDPFRAAMLPFASSAMYIADAFGGPEAFFRGIFIMSAPWALDSPYIIHK